MNRRTFLFLAAAMPSACDAGFSSDEYSWRQKLTVTVDTPQGTKTGSAVSEIGITLKNTRGNRAPKVKGEATVVEITPGQYLFALLSGQLFYSPTLVNTDEWAEILWRDVLPQHRFPGVDAIKFDYRREWGPTYAAIPKLRGERNMPVSLWPAFATFVDLNAAQSVRVVEPARMAEFFGQGVSIRSVSLEITGEPVTGGIVQSHLPWIGNIKGVLIPAPPKSDGDYSPEERIRGLNFRRDV